MQPVALCRSLLNQITVTIRKGIGVHHNAANLVPWMTKFFQRFGIAFQSRGAVFHQHHHAGYAGQRGKTALAEQRLVFGFGINNLIIFPAIPPHAISFSSRVTVINTSTVVSTLKSFSCRNWAISAIFLFSERFTRVKISLPNIINSILKVHVVIDLQRMLFNVAN